MKVLSVVGARPQFVKLWPLATEITEQTEWDHVVVHTGQHYDDAMSEVFFAELDMPSPTHRLQHGGGGHGEMTGAMLIDLERLLLAEGPDVVVVFGDTNSTLAGALAAAKLGIGLAHVEAGLRSGVRAMPEEINRILTDHVSDILLCPTGEAVSNLVDEGITEGVSHVGDIMHDAVRLAARRTGDRAAVLASHGLEDGPYAVVTLHRASLTDDRERLAEALDWLDKRAAESRLVWPLHPRTRAAIDRFGLGLGDLHTIEPVSYLAMAGLVGNADHVYTDSGGLQKEAYFHRVSCTTLRDETEWPETVEAGWNHLWREAPSVVERCDIPDYGDGTAAATIVDRIAALAEATS